MAMANKTLTIEQKAAINRAVQWVLEHLHNGTNPLQEDLDTIAMSPPTALVVNELIDRWEKNGKKGLKSVLFAFRKDHSWLMDLRSEELPSRNGTENEKQEKPKEHRYQLQPLSYFKSKPQRDWGVDQIVFDRGSSIFVGDSGSGKSTFVLNMFLSRACGVGFINRLTKPAFLVWVAGESSDELYPRVAAFLACHKIQEDQLKNFLALDNCMPFNEVAEVQTFIKEVKEQLESIGVNQETHSIVFVFDTYAKCTPGADENSTQETKIITASIDEISKTFNAHVSIIHHNNAKGKIRGNTAFKGSVDTLWEVSKEGDIMKLHCDKMRGTRTPDDFTAEVRSIILDSDNIGAPDSSAPVIFPSNAKGNNFTPIAHIQMLQILSAKGQLTSGDWQKLCEEQHKISRASFYNYVKVLTKQELINAPADDEKEPGKKVYYSLSPKGVQLLG